MSRTSPAYDHLTRAFARTHRLEHAHDMLSWDQAAKMPPSGRSARAAAMAELATLIHAQRTAADVDAALRAAADEPLDDAQCANRHEMQRIWRQATALPADLVARRTLVTARCEHAWRSQRLANDWTGFAANLREVLEIVREEARRLAEASGLSPYDALLDLHEPGMSSAEVARLFDDLRQWLPGLVRQAVQRQAEESLLRPRGPFDLGAQHRLCERVMRLLDFDFDGGRLDVSSHPFSGGAPEDVRLTTRYREEDFLLSLMSTIHETGHGRYEQNLPREWVDQPLGKARSMGIHESQSLAFEMQLASHPGFARLLSPLLAEAFGPDPAFAPDNLHRLLTRVTPGRIRVEADELSYPAHVMLRFDIERALIEDGAEVDDIPDLWDAGMAALLGVDTRGDYRDGPMQDVHWPSGSFGYFPCYTLGAMYAAQWFAAMRRAQPDLDARIGGGDLSPVFDWLREHVWQQASRWPTDELARRASGEPLNPAHFRAHLTQRYLG
jgi:carboxypeptidase Taq